MKAARWSLRRTISYNKFHLGKKERRAQFFGVFLQVCCKCDVVKNYGRLVAENPRCFLSYNCVCSALRCDTLLCFVFQSRKLSNWRLT